MFSPVPDETLVLTGETLLRFLRAAAPESSGLVYLEDQGGSSGGASEATEGGTPGGRLLPPVDGGSVFFDVLHMW